MTDIKRLLSENYASVEKRLSEYMDTFGNNTPWSRCTEAMRYSLIAGGKAIRPFLTVAFSRLFGGDTDLALTLGCAVEMMHASSLVHDDLPAMDNDDMRRGKPSCHIKYGEYTAILAGDALMISSFDMLTRNVPPSISAEAVHLLATNAGPLGMIGGQQLDLEYESEKEVSEEMLSEMCKMKTGALINLSCLLGVLSAKERLSPSEYDKAQESASEYAYSLGLAFQIYDDVLDVIGDEATLGKPIGSDASEGKTTYVDVLGLKGAKARYREYTDRAISSIKNYKGSEELVSLAEALIRRDK